MKLTKDMIDSIFAQAENPLEALTGLYRTAFPDWDEILRLEDFPVVSFETNNYITEKFILQDAPKRESLGFFWINHGFASGECRDWEVIPCDAIYKEEQDDS